MQQDFAALQWVTAEIEQTARQFGAELLSFADNVSDETRLRQSLTLAHQIHATLRLLSVPSAEQLARETEQTVQAILHGRVEAAGTVLQALLSASTQIPAYLRRVASERRELPFEVFDLVNELRELRGEAPEPPPSADILLEPAELAEGGGDDAVDATDDQSAQLAALAGQLRSALPGLLARHGIHAALRELGESASALAAAWPPGARRRMLQATVALCDAVLLGGVDVDERFDGCLRGISEDLDACVHAGPRASAVPPPEALYRDLLAFVADSRPASGPLIDIQRRYRLVPGRRASRPPVDPQASGADAAGAGEIAARLAGVLQRLEGSEGDAGSIARALHEVEAELQAIAEQLAATGYREAHEMLLPQLERIAAGTLDGDGAEDRLTEITMALLEIDQSLAARIAASGEGGESMEQRRHPLARARAALYREVQVLIEQAKQALANHAGETAGGGLIGELPAPLHAAAGALRLAGLDAPAAVLSACRAYALRVAGDELPPPSSPQIEALAEAFSAVEYYLERLQIDGQPTDLILDRVSDAVSALTGIPPAAPVPETPESEVPAAEVPPAIEPMPQIAAASAPEEPALPAEPLEDARLPAEEVTTVAGAEVAPEPLAAVERQAPPEPAIAAPVARPATPAAAARSQGAPDSATPQDLVALQWTVDEIERTAGQLVEELLGYADNASDPTRLRFSLTLAHQLSATLALVGVAPARRFAQEIEDTLQVLVNGTVASTAEAMQDLVTATRALPSFLRRMLAERRALPLETVPSVNTLRALRGEAMLPPPDLVGMLELPELAQGCGDGAPAGSAEDVLLLRRARQRFQLELVGILREDRVGERMRTLARLFRSLGERDWGAGQRLLWETCGTLCEAVAMDGLACDDRLRSCLRDIDNELRAFIGLEGAFRSRAPSEPLYRALLTALAESRPVSEPVLALQQRYRLVSARGAPETEGAEASARESGAIAAISRELGRIFERIEGSGGDSDAIDAVLRELQPVLSQIHGMLLAGEFAPEAALLRTELARLGSEPPAGADQQEERLTEITMTLLEVDQRLAARGIRPGTPESVSDGRRHPLVLARETVCREVQAGIEQAKQAVSDYTRTGEAAATLAELPVRLGALVGALRLAGLPGAEAILAACRAYLAEVLAGRQASPDNTDVERLADGLSSVEYFLERLLQDGEPSELILARSRESISRLGQGAVELPSPDPMAAPAQAAPEPAPATPEPAREEWLPEAGHARDLADLGAEEELASGTGEQLAGEPGAFAPLTEEEPLSAREEEALELASGTTRLPAEELLPPEPLDADVLPSALEPEPVELAALEPEALAAAPEYPIEEMLSLEPLDADALAFAPEPEAVELAALEPGMFEVPAPEPEPMAFEEPMAEEAFPVAEPEREAGVAAQAELPVQAPEPPAGVVEEPLDPEIVEIFVEEAAEVLQTIAEHLPGWRAAPVPGVALTELRRAFHTLKGSGRMVGAEVIGELAWSIEHLLNRVIERTVVPGPEVVEALERAQSLMPGLVSCFAERRAVDLAPVERVKAFAGALARGEGVRWEEEPPALPVRPPAVLVTEETAEAQAAEVPEAGELPAAPELLEEELTAAEPEGEVLDVSAVEAPLPEAEPVEAIDSWQPELQPEEVLASGELEEAAERLLGIFADEAAEHLAELEGWLGSASEPIVGDRTMRAVHTLKGSARVAGVTPLAELMEPLDALVRAAGAAPRAPEPAERALLEAACALLRELVAARMRVDAPTAERAAVLREQAQALLSETLTDRQAAAADEARLARFLEEALEKLFHATNLLDAWGAGTEPEANRAALRGELLAIQQRTEQLGVRALLPLAAALASAVPRATVTVGLGALKQGVEAFLDALDRLAAGQQPEVPAAVVDALLDICAEAPAAPPVVERAGVAPEAELLRTRIARDLQQAEQDLLGIFLEEAEELMAAIDQDIDDWRHDRANRAPFERLQRSLHTLKGGARMAGLKTLGELSHHFETFLINQSVQFGSFDDPFFLRVADLHEQLLQTMDIVRERPALPAGASATAEEPYLGMPIVPEPEPEAAPAPAPGMPDAARSGELPAAALDVPAPVPASVPAPDASLREQVARELLAADPDLLGVFLEEAEELIASIDSGIDSWRADRGSEAAFDQLKRDLHTLKGGARMAGITSLGELAHAFESMLIAEAARPEARDDAFFERVLGFHERLMRVMDIIRDRPVPGQAATPSTEPPTETVSAPPAPVAVAAATVPLPAAPASSPVAPPVRMPAAAAGEAARTTVPVRDEVVRVSAQLLEDLVNLAGETSISRGRVEEQVSELGKLFDDMQGTIERLQSQVRRLDIATEAQILFRRERAESAGSEGFDPLEMDRYSQLQQLSRSLVESASDLLDIKRTLADKTRDLETVLIQQSRINSQLQEGLMRSRMVPFSSILPRVKRVVRQVAGELGKSVELELGNMAGELDRGILERVVAPMEHMLRNAVDHGIESREKRLAAGKPETGRILIEIAREGGDVLISVSDDGGGVKIDAVRRKAIERGLMKPDEELSDHEVVQFILNSGFSTAEKVTQISGRGVGMDVVSSEIRQMGGSLEIRSTEGKGSCFVIRLPFTVSVSRSLMVTAGSETYALPLNTVVGVLRMSSQELARYVGPDAEPLEYAGHSYVMRHLGDLLYPGEQVDLAPTEDTVPVVLVRGGGQSIAVEVDRLVGAREVVVKSLGPQFGAVPGLSGATVLGDGSVVLILDIPAMLRADAALGAERAAATRVAPKAQADRPPLIMVVDDSVTVRKVTTRFLEREGMRVITAKDGAEAMTLLQEQVPDLMLLDIEMPHMDGFEVLSKVRLSDALRQLPVIMITSRTGEKHRERALALGANQYLGKPYQENILLEHVRALLKRRGG